jgi:hypothetical protein
VIGLLGRNPAWYSVKKYKQVIKVSARTVLNKLFVVVDVDDVVFQLIVCRTVTAGFVSPLN